MHRSKWKPGALRASLLLMVGCVAWEYSRWCYQHSLWLAMQIVHGLDERPFVYRALVSWMALGLVKLGLREDTALSAVVIFWAICFVYALEFFLDGRRKAG